MPGFGTRGKVVEVDSFGGAATAMVDGERVAVRALRGSLMSCGDLVVVVGRRNGVLIVDVVSAGELLPVVVGRPRRV